MSPLPRDAEPTAPSDDVAAANGVEGKKRRRKARKFLYKTGDKPLEGYTIKRGVGQGGFGEVYFATSDAGKEVALKLLRRNLDIELRGVRQCLNLKHPNLISLYDIRTDRMEDEWVVMEYVGGESLEDLLARSPEGIGPEAAVAWMHGVAAGVSHLHQNGIVHRDLKPGNLFLEGAPGAEATPTNIKIGDYGLAKFISASRRSGQTESVGTIHYMAPEISGGRYGREIDTYALGVILYEMLTGRVPFDGESAGEVLMKHLTADPGLSGVDPRFHTVIRRALAKDPETRIGTVEEMIALLPNFKTDFANGEPVLDEAIPQDNGSQGDGPQVWSPVSTPPHKATDSPSKEPLWQGLVELTETGRERWHNWPATPLAKGLALMGLVGFAFVTSGVWLGLLITILPFYVIYYVIWSAFLQEAAAPAPLSQVGPNGRTMAGSQPLSSKPTANRARRYNWRDAARQQLRQRTRRHRLRTLIGSMLVAALVTSVASTLAVPVLLDGALEADLSYLANGAPLGLWLAVVSTLGSWGVLISNALTETSVEDHAPRRGLQLLFGIMLGLAAFGLASMLDLQLPWWDDASPRGQECLLEKMFDVDLYQAVEPGSSQLTVPPLASAVYFGLLFLGIRWWRSAEYIRRRRIGFMSIASVALLAWLLTLVAWYPQPIGMVLAAVIAFATQAASIWLPPSERATLARGVNAIGGA